MTQVYQKMKQSYSEYLVRTEEKLLSYFTNEIDNDTDKAIYGLKMVKEYLKNGYLKHLYINRDYYQDKIYKIEKLCNNYGCTLILIGKSALGQQLSNGYGNMFGISWFVIP